MILPYMKNEMQFIMYIVCMAVAGQRIALRGGGGIESV